MVHLGVADALSGGEGAGVDAVGSGGEGGEGVGDRQAAIVVAVPVHADVFSGWFHYFIQNKFCEGECASGSGMAGGVADDDGARAAVDGRRVEALDGGRVAAAGVFGDVHDVEAEGDGELYGLFGGLEEEVVGPTFGVAADGAGSDEGGGFDVEAGAVDDFGDGGNVVFVSAGGAVGTNL